MKQSIFHKYIREAWAKYQNLNIAIKCSFWFVICSFIQKGISFITMPIFTRLMDTNQYGRYNIYLAWYNIFTIIITLKVHAEIFNKGLTKYSRTIDQFSSNQTGLLITLSSMWLVIYIVFSNRINSLLSLTTPVGILIILDILTTAIIGLWTNKKRFEYDYKKIVLLTLTITILNPLIGILLIFHTENKAEFRIASNTIIPTIFSIIIIYLFSKKASLFSYPKIWFKVVKECLPLIPHYLSLVLLNQSDKLMINRFCGETDAALYSVAHTSGLIMVLVNGSINASFVPWLYQKIKSNLVRDVKDITFVLLIIVALSNLIVIWFAPEIIQLLAPSEYYESITCIAPISMSVFFTFVYTLLIDVEIYYGANYYIAIASVIAATSNIILNYIFIPKYGFLAAGYTTLACYFITMLFHLIFTKVVLSRHKKNVFIISISKMFIIALIFIGFSFLSLLLYNHRFVRLSIIAILALFITFFFKRVYSTVKIFVKK